MGAICLGRMETHDVLVGTDKEITSMGTICLGRMETHDVLVRTDKEITSVVSSSGIIYIPILCMSRTGSEHMRCSIT